jgi:two-component system, NarL family, response regulator NreC
LEINVAIEVLLADDHQLVREGFRALLERAGFEVVAEAADGYQAVGLAEELKPQIAVLDLAMPLLNGVGAAREICRVSPKTQTIMLTMYREDHYLFQAMDAGCAGYLLKTRATKDLVQAIQDVLQGVTYLSPEISETFFRAHRGQVRPTLDPLTPREHQVLQLVAEGRTTREIACLLGISAKTAEAHRTRLMQKVQVHDVAGLVRYAIRVGDARP